MNTNNHTPAQPINTQAAWRPVLKPIGRFLVLAQLALALQPLSVLAQDKGQAPFNPQAQAQMQRLGQWSQKMEQGKALKAKQAQSPADQVSDKLARVHELSLSVSNANPRLALAPAQRSQRVTELRELLADVNAGVASVRAEFDATRAELVAKKLPAEILARHDEAVAQFGQRSAQFREITQRLMPNRASAPMGAGQGATQSIATTGSGEEQQALVELRQFFEKFPAQRKPGLRDMSKLPWSTPKPATRAPSETKSAWQQQLAVPEQVRSASTGTTSIGPLQFSTAPEPAQAPTLADLAETDEIQLTPAIRAKAAELGNNPVTIYNWVRNNIDFAPTAGAIQSAQDTFDKKRGNATDTASLLIALLRAANIPARYQFGTVDINAQKVQNWVGGATVPEAALQILNQGGIAARGMGTSRITTIRMEHAWVSVYANWTPSRGNRNATATQHPNPNAPLNAWVPLDASFKQYTYTPGMDLKTEVPLDAQALLDAARQGATINEAEGWVQNLNQAAIQTQLTAYQNQLKVYVDSTPTGTSSTVGDVIGKKLVPQQVQSLLAGTLPHAVVQQGAEVSAVPAALQHKFTYKLYASDTDQANGSPMLVFLEKTSKIVGKRLTLSYVPATQADADVIASYLPRPHADGSPIDPSELPSSLPGYLIRLRAQINLDGVVVAQADRALNMGTDLYSTGGFTQLYDPNQWDLTSEETNVVGQITAIGVSAGGISVPQLTQLKRRVQAAEGRLQVGDVTGLSGEQISGDLLAATLWSWFAASEGHNRLSEKSAGVVEIPGLGYGLFHASAHPIASWGVIRKVTFPGVNMDISHVRNLTWTIDNDINKWVAYNRMRGQYMSAQEGMAPEILLNNSNQCNLSRETSLNHALSGCPRGISAVTAIAFAAKAGQKVFTITPDAYASNPSIISQDLSAHSQSTVARIQQALDVGYEVTIHEAPINLDGWIGAGLVVLDSSTGAGGYLIEGGANGAWLLGLVFGALGVLAIALLPIVFSGTFAGLYAFIALLVVIGLLLALGAYYRSLDDQSKACFRGGALTAVGLGGAPGLIGSNFVAVLMWLVGLAPNFANLPAAGSFQDCVLQ